MADTFKVLYQGQLGNTVATLATVGAAKMWVIKSITIVNTDSSSRTCGLYVNGTVAANAIIPTSTSIAAGGCVIDDTTRTLNAGDTLAGGASVASKLTITVHGDEIS